MAGIGKSTLACSACECAVQQKLLFVSFFFSRAQEDLSRAKLFATTLAHRLGQCDHRIRSRIAEFLEENPDIPFQPHQTQITELIIKPLLASNIQHPIIVVLDALDECEPKDAQEVLRLIIMCTRQVPLIRFLITSRPEPHITDILLPLTEIKSLILHNVEEHVIASDIQLYLRAKLCNIATEFGPSLPLEWPDNVELNTLVERSGNLFIYAATVVRFVGDEKVWNPKTQLSIVLGSRTVIGANPHAELDGLYLHVLKNAVPSSQRMDIVDRFQIVLGTLLLLHDPLPIAAIAGLLGIEEHDIAAVLRPLHSLILQTNDIGTPPQIYHKSFSDFITDPTRCTESKFLIDRGVQSSRFTQQCFRAMAEGLKKNLIGLTDPFIPNEDVPDMAIRLVSGFLLELRYACRYWVSHLLEASLADSPALVRGLEEFVSRSILLWIEAMSFLGQVTAAASSLQEIRAWAVSIAEFSH